MGKQTAACFVNSHTNHNKRNCGGQTKVRTTENPDFLHFRVDLVPLQIVCELELSKASLCSSLGHRLSKACQKPLKLQDTYKGIYPVYMYPNIWKVEGRFLKKDSGNFKQFSAIVVSGKSSTIITDFGCLL